MTDLQLVPGTVAANPAGILRLYRATLSQCWLPSLLLALVWAGFSALLGHRLQTTQDLLRWIVQLQALLSSAFFWRLLVAASGISVLLYCAMVASIHAAATGGIARAAGLVPALRAFPAALLAATVFLLFTSAGTALLALPGAYLWGMWQLWLVVLMAEHTGPFTALRRSWQLVRGCWWRITTLVSIVTILSMLPAPIFGLLLGPALALAGVDAGHSLAIVAIAGGVLDAILLPLIPAALVTVYLERTRSLSIQRA